MKEFTTPPDRIIPLVDWPNFHFWPPIGGLRHLVFNEENNGFSHCIIRKGGRILISEKKFFEWLKSNDAPGKDLH